MPTRLLPTEARPTFDRLANESLAAGANILVTPANYSSYLLCKRKTTRLITGQLIQPRDQPLLLLYSIPTPAITCAKSDLAPLTLFPPGGPEWIRTTDPCVISTVL